MKAVLTRVSEASVTVDDEVVGSITNGVLALVGIGRDDAPDAWQTMVRKIAELRILPEERSVSEMGAPGVVGEPIHAFGANGEGAAAVVVGRGPGGGGQDRHGEDRGRAAGAWGSWSRRAGLGR